MAFAPTFVGGLAPTVAQQPPPMGFGATVPADYTPSGLFYKGMAPDTPVKYPQYMSEGPRTSMGLGMGRVLQTPQKLPHVRDPTLPRRVARYEHDQYQRALPRDPSQHPLEQDVRNYLLQHCALKPGRAAQITSSIMPPGTTGYSGVNVQPLVW